MSSRTRWRLRSTRRRPRRSSRTRRHESPQLEALEDRCLLAAVRLDAEVTTGDVSRQYELSADGRFGVYLADAETDSRQELYSVEFSTGEVRQLSGDAFSGSVREFEISPDNATAVYAAWEESTWALHRVPLAGGEPSRLTTPLRGHLVDLVISPDGSRVVYLSDYFEYTFDGLFSLAIDGGSIDRLSTLRPDHSVREGFEISNDSRRVVFRAGQSRTDALYSSPLAGGELIKLADLSPNRFHANDEQIFEILRDSSQAVFLSDSELYTVALTGGELRSLGKDVKAGFQVSPDSEDVIFVSGDNLFRTPILDGAPVQLSPEASAARVQADAQISPDGAWVVYRADRDADATFELYSVPLAGGDSRRLDSLPFNDGNVSVPTEAVDTAIFQITADSQHVLYFSGQPSLGEVELFGVPLASGEAIKLSHQPLQTNWYTNDRTPRDQRYPQVSANGRHVIYVANRELFSAPLDGGEAQKLNAALAPNGQVSGFRTAPTSDRVLYRGILDQPGVWELYSAPTTGGDSVKHNRPIVAMGHVAGSSYSLTSDGKYAIYRWELDPDQETELFRMDLETGEVTQLSSEDQEGDTWSYTVSPDGQWVVYRTDRQLASVPLAGGPPITLHDLPGSWRVDRELLITDDGHRVVYSARELSGKMTGIYSARLDGGPTVRLVESTEVNNWWVSPDGQWLVASTPSGVFSVPVAGGPANQLLGEPLDSFDRLEISPNSSRVVVWGNVDAIQGNELSSIPIAGGDWVQLNGSGAAHKNFAFSATSDRVIYLANQDALGARELFSVPTSGGPVTKLNGPLARQIENSPSAIGEVRANWGDYPTVGTVSAFKLSPDGNRVVYLADQDTFEQPELYSVPVVGGTPKRLNHALPAGLSVFSEFEITPDGGSVTFQAGPEEGQPADLFHVDLDGGEVVKLGDSVLVNVPYRRPRFVYGEGRLLFRGENEDNSVVTLYSAALDGSGTTPLSANNKVGAVQISPNGRQVVYLAEGDSFRQSELFVAPITGGRVERLNDPLVAGGTVYGFQLHPHDSRIVYQASQDVRNQTGLYSRRLPEQRDLLVTSVVPDASGFTLEFNAPLSRDRLNLYDAAGQGQADLVVHGESTGDVAGSVVLDQSGQRLRFIKTGSHLTADAYTVTLKSGDTGVHSADGYRLNGDGKGLADDDFSTKFTIAATDRVVGLPDLVQSAGAATLPLTIGDGGDVASAALRIHYDPALLEIVQATAGETMPAGSQVTLDTSSPGRANLAFTSPTSLPPGEQVLIELQVNVPESAASDHYGQHGVVLLGDVQIKDIAEKPLPVMAEHALQMVSLFGDVSLNGRINAFDARLVARVAARLDTGFARSKLVDPIVVADISGNGVVNATDALHLFALGAGLDPGMLPPSPPPKDDSPPPPTQNPPAPQPALTQRLDTPLAKTGDVIDFELSADGRSAIYRADSEVDGRFELYRTDLASSEVKRLTRAADEGSVYDFRFSPDGQRLVYRTERQEDGLDLRSVSVQGGTSIQLNHSTTGTVALDPKTNIAFTPGGDAVTFRAAATAIELPELYYIPISGGISEQLVQTRAVPHTLWEFELPADNSARLLLRNLGYGSRYELYFIDQAATLDSFHVVRHETSRDGRWDVYIDADDGNLYSKQRGTDTSRKLNGELTSSRRVEAFLIDPNSEQVYYVADQDFRQSLYRVPIGGGAATKLGGGSHVSAAIQLTPDGSRIIYTEGGRLVSRSLAHIAHATELSDGLDWASRPMISPDSRFVAFWARHGRHTQSDRTFGVYTVPVAGGNYVSLTTTRKTDRIGDFAFTRDSNQLVYVSEAGDTGVSHLYRSPTLGGTAIQLNAPHVAVGGAVTHMRATPDGQFVVYRANQRLDGVFDLYAVSTVTGGMVQLTDLPISQNVEPDFVISADGSRVVFRVSDVRPFRTELYSVRLTGGGLVRLSPLPARTDIDEFQISPDSSRVLYRIGSQLLTVPLAGGQIARLDDNSLLWRFKFSPDGQYVVYQLEHPRNIYSIPVTGGNPVQLNGQLRLGEELPDFRVSGDGSRVVYSVIRFNDSKDLFSVPIEGGVSQRLNGGNDTDSIHDFEITPDGQRVLFRAGEYDIKLYSVPATGGTPIRLSDPSRGHAQPFPVVEGDRVFYLVSESRRTFWRNASEVTGDLYSVPITGGAASLILEAGQGVQAGFQVSANGQLVVYRAPQGEGRLELFAAPISGGEPVKLNRPLAPDGEVLEFSALPIYNWVVYSARHTSTTGSGVYRTSLRR